MKNEDAITSWKDFAFRTQYEIESIKENLLRSENQNKELRTKLNVERNEREKLEKKYIRLEAQIYTVAAILIIVFGIIELSINIFSK